MFNLGIDVGGTKINIGIVDENKKLLVSEKFIILEEFKGENFICFLNTCVNKFLISNDISKNQIGFCGIGVPGTVDETRKIAVKVPNLNFKNYNISDEFEKISNIRSKLIQDSRAAALGEYLVGGAIGKKLLLIIALGTGIGVGIVGNGKVFNGGMGNAGELGHSPIITNGRRCGCGKNGCLECYSAGKGLEISAKESFGDNATTTVLFENAKNNNEIALKILDTAATYIGRAITSAANLISPDCILFSGGLSTQKELYCDKIIEFVKNNVYTCENQKIYIDYAKLGENSPLIGAALSEKA